MTPRKVHLSKPSVKKLRSSFSHNSSHAVSSAQEIPKLELIPEVVDKRTYDKRKINPDYIFAGSLYIPRNILRLVTAEEKIPESRDKYEKVFPNDHQGISEYLIEVKDPVLRKYIQRIVRYSTYNYDDALIIVRKASYEIKHQARYTIQNATTEDVEVWKSTIIFNQEDSESSEETVGGMQVQAFQRTQPKDTPGSTPSLLQRLLGAKMTVNCITKGKLLQRKYFLLMTIKPLEKPMKTLPVTSNCRYKHKDGNCKAFFKYKYSNVRQFKIRRPAFVQTKLSPAVEYLGCVRNTLSLLSEDKIFGETGSSLYQEVLNTDFKKNAQNKWDVKNVLRHLGRKKNSFDLFSKVFNNKFNILPSLDHNIFLTTNFPDLKRGELAYLYGTDVIVTFYGAVNYYCFRNDFSCCCCKCGQKIRVRKKDGKVYNDSFLSDSEISEETVLSKSDYRESEKKIMKPYAETSKEKRPKKERRQVKKQDSHRQRKYKPLFHSPHFIKRLSIKKPKNTKKTPKNSKASFLYPMKKAVSTKQKLSALPENARNFGAAEEIRMLPQKTSGRTSKPLFYSPIINRRISSQSNGKEEETKSIKKLPREKAPRKKHAPKEKVETLKSKPIKTLEENTNHKMLKKEKKKVDKDITLPKDSKKSEFTQKSNSLFRSPRIGQLPPRIAKESKAKKSPIMPIKEIRKQGKKSFHSKRCVANEIVDQIKIGVEYGSCNAFTTSVSTKEKIGSNGVKLMGNTILLEIVANKPSLKDSTTTTSSISCLCRPVTSSKNNDLSYTNTAVTSAFYGLFYDKSLKGEKCLEPLGKKRKIRLYKGASEQKIKPLFSNNLIHGFGQSSAAGSLYRLKNVKSVPLTNAASLKKSVKNIAKNCKYVYTSKSHTKPVNREKLLVLSKEINGREYSVRNLHESSIKSLESDQNVDNLNFNPESNNQECSVKKDDTIDSMPKKQECFTNRESKHVNHKVVKHNRCCSTEQSCLCCSIIQRNFDRGGENNRTSIVKEAQNYTKKENFIQTSRKRKMFPNCFRFHKKETRLSSSFNLPNKTFDGSLTDSVLRTGKKITHSYPKLSKILNLHLSQDFSTPSDSDNEENNKNDELNSKSFNSIYPCDLNFTNKEPVYCIENYWSTFGHGLKYDTKKNSLFASKEKIPMTYGESRGVMYLPGSSNNEISNFQHGSYNGETLKYSLSNREQEDGEIEGNSTIKQTVTLKECGVQTKNINENPPMNKSKGGFYTAISMSSCSQDSQKQPNHIHSNLNKIIAQTNSDYYSNLNLSTFSAINDVQNYNFSLKNENLTQNSKENNDSTNVDNKNELTTKDGRNSAGLKASKNDENPINLFLGNPKDMAKCAFVSISNVEKVVICGPECNNLVGKTKIGDDAAKTSEEFIPSYQELDQQDSEFSPMAEVLEQTSHIQSSYRDPQEQVERQLSEEILSRHTQTFSFGPEPDDLEPSERISKHFSVERKGSEIPLKSDLMGLTGEEFADYKHPSARKSHAFSETETMEMAEKERTSHISSGKLPSMRSRSSRNLSLKSTDTGFSETSEVQEESPHLSERTSVKRKSSRKFSKEQPETIQMDEDFERISRFSSEKQPSLRSHHSQKPSLHFAESEIPDSEMTERPPSVRSRQSQKPSLYLAESEDPDTSRMSERKPSALSHGSQKSITKPEDIEYPEMIRSSERISHHISDRQPSKRSHRSQKLSSHFAESEDPDTSRMSERTSSAMSRGSQKSIMKSEDIEYPEMIRSSERISHHISERQPSERSHRSQKMSSHFAESEDPDLSGMTGRKSSAISRGSRKSITKPDDIEYPEMIRSSERISHHFSERQPSIRSHRSQKLSTHLAESEDPDISEMTERQQSVRSRVSQTSTTNPAEMEHPEMIGFSESILQHSSESHRSIRSHPSQKTSLLITESEYEESTRVSERQPSVRSGSQRQSSTSSTERQSIAQRKSSQKSAFEPAEITEESKRISHFSSETQPSIRSSGSRMLSKLSDTVPTELRSSSQKLSKLSAEPEPEESDPSIKSHDSQKLSSYSKHSSYIRRSTKITEEPESQHMGTGVLGNFPSALRQHKDTLSTQNSVFSSESPIFVHVRQENSASKKRFVCYELDENGKVQSQILFPFAPNTSEAQTSTMQQFGDEFPEVKVQTKHDSFQQTPSIHSNMHSIHHSSTIGNELFSRKSRQRNSSKASNEFDATHSRYSYQQYQKGVVQCSNKCNCLKNKRASHNYTGQGNETGSSYGNHRMSLGSPPYQTNESKHLTKEVVGESLCRRMNVVWKCKCQQMKNKDNNKDGKILKDGADSSKEKDMSEPKETFRHTDKSKLRNFNCCFVYLPDYQHIYQSKDLIKFYNSIPNEIKSKYSQKKEKLSKTQSGKTFEGSNINTKPNIDTLDVQMVLMPLRKQKIVVLEGKEKRSMISKKNKQHNRSYFNFRSNCQTLPNIGLSNCKCNQEHSDYYFDFCTQYKKKSIYSKKKLSITKKDCNKIFSNSEKGPIKNCKYIIKNKMKYNECKNNFVFPNKKPNENIYSMTDHYCNNNCNKVFPSTGKEMFSNRCGRFQTEDQIQILKKNKNKGKRCFLKEQKIRLRESMPGDTQVDIEKKHRCYKTNYIKKRQDYMDYHKTYHNQSDRMLGTQEKNNLYYNQGSSFHEFQRARRVTKKKHIFIPSNNVKCTGLPQKTKETGTLTDIDCMRTNFKIIRGETKTYSSNINNNNNVNFEGNLQFKEPKMEHSRHTENKFTEIYNGSRRNKNINSTHKNSLHERNRRETVQFSGKLIFEENTPPIDKNYGGLSAHILHQTLKHLLNKGEQKNTNSEHSPISREDYSFKCDQTNTCSSHSLGNEESDFSGKRLSDDPNQSMVASYSYDGSKSRIPFELMRKSREATGEESKESVVSQSSDVKSCDDYLYSTLGINNKFKESKTESNGEYILKKCFPDSSTLVNSMNSNFRYESSETKDLSNILLERAFKPPKYRLSRFRRGSFKDNTMCINRESSFLSYKSKLYSSSDSSFSGHE